ncbi:unnamed protein product [Gordionus sp. m RMFG-2023]
MFILTNLKDITILAPTQFDKDFNEAIKEYINQKYANKLGLAISLWDIQKFEHSYILQNDSNAYTRVFFRYVIFSPFIDEIIIGKIKSSTQDGIHITIGFFDDIIVPSHLFQEKSLFDEKEQTWYWEYQTIVDEQDIQEIRQEMSPKSHKLFMDVGEEIRFRIIDKIYIDNNLTNMVKDSDQPSSFTNLSNKNINENNLPNYLGNNPAPMTLIGSIAEPGLGLLTWWT